MTEEINGAVKSLDSIVHRCMTDLRETSMKNYPFYLNWAYDGWRDLHLFAYPAFKTCCIPMSDRNTICVPNDYVEYIALGIVICGRVWLLSLKDDIIGKQKENQFSIEQAATGTFLGDVGGIYPYYYFFNGAFRGGQYVGEQFAMGGGWNSRGYFKENKEQKEFQFESVCPRSEIFLEYKSTGIECDGSVAVPFEAISALKAYVHWQIVEHDKKESLAAKQRKEMLYGKEFNDFKHFQLRFSVREYHENKLRVSRASPTR